MMGWSVVGLEVLEYLGNLDIGHCPSIGGIYTYPDCGLNYIYYFIPYISMQVLYLMSSCGQTRLPPKERHIPLYDYARVF